MSDFEIVMYKTLVKPELLLRDEPSLPEAMRLLNLCEAFVAVKGGKAISVCLLSSSKGHYNVTCLALDENHSGTGADKELLLYALDYARARGGASVEIGTGNAQLKRHEMFTMMGFRVVGVWRDHFPGKGDNSTSSGSPIPNRDLLRYRIEFGG